MAKKKSAKTVKGSSKTPAGDTAQGNLAKTGVTKQTAGAMTGAVIGSVGGPIGALAGGALGAMVGDMSAKGKRPIRRVAEAIREEITSGRAKEALKSVGARIKSLGKSKKKAVTKSAPVAAAGVKKKKKAAAAAGTKKAKSATAARPKKRAKKSG
jgi:hypothetical protein